MALPWEKAALAAALVLGVSGTAASQDAEGGLQFTLDVSTGLRVHSNRDLDPVSAGPTTRSDTTLGFSIFSETRRQRLALDFGATLRAEDAPGTGFGTGVENPYVTLGYALDGTNSRLAFDASFSRTDVDGFTALEEGEDPDTADLIEDDGFRDRLRFGVTLETGTNSPLGFILDLGHDATLYSGTSDPGLFENATDTVSATTVLRFSPVTEGRVTASLERYEAEDAVMTTRDTSALSFGLNYEFPGGIVFDTSLGYREIDSSVTGVNSGAEAAVGLTRTLPRGSVSLTLATELTAADKRSTVEVERAFDLPDGSLTLSLGAVDFEGADPQPIGSLRYVREISRGTISASLSRNVSVNSDAAVQRTTRGALGLSYDMNALSAVAFDLDYTDIDDAGAGGVAGSARGSFRATYRHALAQDWSLSAGYERRYLNEAGAGAAWDNAVFVTIDRTFSWLP